MDDWKNELTEKQLSTISQLRDNVNDVLKPHMDDFYLWRWLKARNFDVVKAEAMMRNSLEWRASFGADTILEDWTPPEVMSKYWPGGVFGHDKEGHPILWQLCKDFDSRTMMKCVKKSDIVRYHIYRMELMMRECEKMTKKFNKRIYNGLHLSDLEGLALGMVFTPGITDAMKQVFALYEANYPENLHTSFVINAPGIFPVIFNILKPFLSEATKKKVHILGRNWQSEVHAIVDPAELPVHWGGHQRVPDDRCTQHITSCSKIPSQYLIPENVPIERESLLTFTVPRGEMHDLRTQVTKSGTVISWVFETDDYDISFGVFYSESMEKAKEKDGPDVRELCPVTRVNSHLIPEDGTLTCAETGVYLLRFDNNFSWVTAKTVHYKLEVVEPCDDEIFTGNLLTTVRSTTNHLESTHL